jgi:hypothetical protein
VVHIVSVYLHITIFISRFIDIKGNGWFSFDFAKQKKGRWISPRPDSLKAKTSRGEQLLDATASATADINMEVQAAKNKGDLFNEPLVERKILRVKKEGHRIAPGPL